MSVFDRCFEHTVGLEGGYYNHPKDKGGPTMYGVAWNFNKKWYNKVGITRSDEVANLTLEQAKEIYFLKYWKPSKCDKFEQYKDLVKTYFDMCIHAGITGTGICLQKAINVILLGESDDLYLDGKVGSKTLAGLNKVLDKVYDPDEELNETNFVTVYNAQRAAYYLEMYNDIDNPSWYGNLRYLNSGLRRLA